MTMFDAPATREERIRALIAMAMTAMNQTHDPGAQWAGSELNSWLHNGGDFESHFGLKGPPGSRNTVSRFLNRSRARILMRQLVERNDDNAAEAARALNDSGHSCDETKCLVCILRGMDPNWSSRKIGRLLDSTRHEDEGERS
jgi:hypothetical protein